MQTALFSIFWCWSTRRCEKKVRHSCDQENATAAHYDDDEEEEEDDHDDDADIFYFAF